VALSAALALCLLIWLLPLLPRPLRWVSACLGIVALVAFGLNINAAPPPMAGGWAPWSAGAVSEAHHAGKAVLVDFSAAWCVTCIVNERVALQDERVVDRIKRDGVVTLKGDWTNHSGLITEELADHGRSGVPLYLLFPAGADGRAFLLPQILTPDIVLDALNKAADSRKASWTN
jgi:thiol:disulfide interchange protein DsbD